MTKEADQRKEMVDILRKVETYFLQEGEKMGDHGEGEASEEAYDTACLLSDIGDFIDRLPESAFR